MKHNRDTQAVADQHTEARPSEKRPRAAEATDQHPAAPPVPVTPAQDAPAQPLTVGQACASSNRTVSAALRRRAQLRFPDAYRTAVDATPIATLLPHLGCYLQHLQHQTAAGVVKGEAAARSAHELHQWLTQQQQLSVGSGVDYQQLSTQIKAAVLALQQLKQQPASQATMRTSQHGRSAARYKSQKAAQPLPSAATAPSTGAVHSAKPAAPTAAAVVQHAAVAAGAVGGSVGDRAAAAAASSSAAPATTAAVDESIYKPDQRPSHMKQKQQQSLPQQQKAVAEQQVQEDGSCRAAKAAAAVKAQAGAWLGAGKVCLVGTAARLPGSTLGRAAPLAVGAAAAAAAAGTAAVTTEGVVAHKTAAAAMAAATDQAMQVDPALLAALPVGSLPRALLLQAFPQLAQRSTACRSAGAVINIKAGAMHRPALAAAAAAAASDGSERGAVVSYNAGAAVAAVRSTAQNSVTWGDRRGHKGHPMLRSQPAAAASSAATAAASWHAAIGLGRVPVIAVPGGSILRQSQLQSLTATLPQAPPAAAARAPAPAPASAVQLSPSTLIASAAAARPAAAAAAVARSAGAAGAPAHNAGVQALFNVFATSVLQQAGMPSTAAGRAGSTMLAKLQQGLAASLGLTQQTVSFQQQEKQQQQCGLPGHMLQQLEHAARPEGAPTVLHMNAYAPCSATADVCASPSKQHAGPRTAAAAATAGIAMRTTTADMQQERPQQQHQQMQGQEPYPADATITPTTTGRLTAGPAGYDEDPAAAAAAAATAAAAAATTEDPAAAATAAVDAAAATPRAMHTTLADLQQLLPGQHKGVDLLLAIAQQVHGSDADPAVLQVGPLLLLWTDPETLQECRDSFRTAGREQRSETLVLLEGLRELLGLPVVVGVLGQKQQQVMADLGGLVDSCRAVLQESGVSCQQEQQQLVQEQQ